YNYSPNWGWIGMLQAFFDESSDGLQQIVFVVAGWTGAAEAWDYVNQEWNRTLCRAGIAEFKAAACEGGFGDFAHRSNDERDALRNDLASIVQSARLSGVVSLINLCESPLSVTVPLGWKAHLYAIQDCLIQAYLSVPDGQRMAVIF